MAPFDYLVNIFKSQQYGEIDRKVSIESVVQRYALFPNEAIYLVDYKTAQLEPLSSNFNKIIGIDAPQKNEVTVLYEHVHKDTMKPFLRYTEQLLKYGFINHERRFSEESDFNLNFYKTIHNRIILKSTTILQYDSENKIRYSVGKLMDVTGLIPFQHFGYKFTGPGSSKIYAAFEGLSEFEEIVSTRELTILNMVGKGMRTHQIARQLNISSHTVDTHKRNIIRKLEATNSIEAYNKALGMGLFK
jgi:DNA-binding CsgD family transcriptional regulator